MKAKKCSSRKNHGKCRKTRLPGFESLEDRKMMAAGVGLSNTGVLNIDAGSEAANIRVFDFCSRVVVAARNDAGVTNYNSFDEAQVKKIVFKGSEFGDKFSNSTDVVDWIYGRGGNDVLSDGRSRSHVEGGAGNDTIHGGDRDDILYGGEGQDTICGNAGDDRINGEAGDDTLWGGAGNDTLWGNAGSDRVYGDDFMGPQGVDHLLGGDGEDWLYGGGGDDTIEGHGGLDHLYGGNGNDALLGGYGDDELFGGWGVDELVGGPGKDYFDGGPMRDTIVDASSTDTVEATVHAQLTIDSLHAIEASDGQPFGSTNEVYMMVAGRQGGVDFGPVRVDPANRDHWSLDTDDTAKNISLWHGNLKPGESIDLVVSLFDHDDAGWDALLGFGKGLLTALPAIPSVLTGNFPAAMASAVNGLTNAVNEAVKAGANGGDDLLGVFLVHVENVDGRISTTWRASSRAIMYEVAETPAGDSANFRTWCSDGEFSVRSSVLEA